MNSYLMTHLSFKQVFLFLAVIVIIKAVGLINHHNAIPLIITTNRKNKHKHTTQKRKTSPYKKQARKR